MQLVRKQLREGKQVASTCRGASFCGYFAGISSSSRPMTHLPARSEWLAGGMTVDSNGRGG
jgi:ribosome modulation factor